MRLSRLHEGGKDDQPQHARPCVLDASCSMQGAGHQLSARAEGNDRGKSSLRHMVKLFTHGITFVSSPLLSGLAAAVLTRTLR
jgi:hypothetical protein